MAVYDPKSRKAEEFINDEEILATIKYAEENKNNVELIDSILEKARPKKTENGAAYPLIFLFQKKVAVQNAGFQIVTKWLQG